MLYAGVRLRTHAKVCPASLRAAAVVLSRRYDVNNSTNGRDPPGNGTNGSQSALANSAVALRFSFLNVCHQHLSRDLRWLCQTTFANALLCQRIRFARLCNAVR